MDNSNVFNIKKSKLFKSFSPSLKEVLKDKDVYIAGGSIRNIFVGGEIKDYDIYFKNYVDLLSIIAWCNEKPIRFISDKSLTIDYEKQSYQFIFFDFFDSPQKLFDTFDFGCCMGAYNFRTNNFEFNDKFWYDNTTKEITFNPSTRFPLCSFIRTFKYSKKYNYFVPPSELIKLGVAVQKKKLDTVDKIVGEFSGMYGFTLKKDLPDNAEELINNIESYIETDIYQESVEKLSLEDLVKIIKEKVGIKTIINHNGVAFEISKNGKYIDWIQGPEKDTFLVYKNVKKTDRGLFSFYNTMFEYKIGDEVCDVKHGLYISNNRDFKYNNYSDSVLIEMIVHFNDILIKSNGYYRTKRAFVNGIVKTIKKDDLDLPI